MSQQADLWSVATVADGDSQVGEYLKYEREKRGISLEEISAQSGLTVSILKALENEDYDFLPELVYVKGYIRVYCSTIGADAEQALKLFSNREQHDAPLVKEQENPSLVDERVEYLTRVWGTVLVAAVIIVVLVGRWSGTEDIVEQESVNATQNEAMPSSVIDAEDAASNVPQSSDKVVNMEEALGLGSLDTRRPAGKTATLSINTRGASWAHIYTEEKSIVYDLLEAGYDQEFVVELPVYIELGDGRNVTILLDGSEYDFSPHISDIHTAFFSVDQPKSE